MDEARLLAAARLVISRLPEPLAFRAANTVYRRWLEGRPFGTTLPGSIGDARFELDLAEWPQVLALLSGRYDRRVVDFIAGRRPSVFVDVGAHVGLITFQVAARTGARVHAFEPHPGAAASFRRNWQLNGGPADVVLHESALAARAATVSFDTRLYQVREGPLQVEATTLDAYMQHVGMPRVDVMKVDVEGYEMNVLRGALGALEQHRIGCMVIELSDFHLRKAGSSPTEVTGLLTECGYRRVEIGRGLDPAFLPISDRTRQRASL